MQTTTSLPAQPTFTKPTFRWKTLILRLLGIIGLLVIGLLVLAWLTPTPGEKKVPAGYTRNESRYLTMRDNTRIAIDVWYPANLAPNQKVPALIDSTRYGRAYRRGYAFRLVRFFGIDYGLNFDTTPATRNVLNAAGYVLILVDARGSGASFGNRPIEMSAAEMADLGEVIDWVVAQPWSNGKVGALGESYGGNTAELGPCLTNVRRDATCLQLAKG